MTTRAATALALLLAPLSAAALECPTSEDLHPRYYESGARLVLTQDDADVRSMFCRGGAGYNLHIYHDETLLGRQHQTASGTTVELGAFTEGEEIVVWIYVPETGQTYYSGPGDRNPDGAVHAAVGDLGDGTYLVGFSDHWGGSWYYEDVKVVIEADATVVLPADTDGDGRGDPVDICPGEDDFVDADASGQPDCVDDELGAELTLTGTATWGWCFGGSPWRQWIPEDFTFTVSVEPGQIPPWDKVDSWYATSSWEAWDGDGVTGTFETEGASYTFPASWLGATVWDDGQGELAYTGWGPNDIYGNLSLKGYGLVPEDRSLLGIDIGLSSWTYGYFVFWDQDTGVTCEMEVVFDGYSARELWPDTDGDGVADDLDECSADPAKAAPGDCGCGAADDDTDIDGVSDCLEERLFLEGRRSNFYFDARRPERSYAQFTGKLELGGGLLAPDFRDGAVGLASVAVDVGCASPVEIYDEDLAFSVQDGASSTDNRERWRYAESAVEQASIHWKDSQKYNSARDADLPGLGEDGDLGVLRSRYVHADETRLRYRWDADTLLPLTIAVDGVPVLTVIDDPAGACVEDAVTTCLDGYQVVSSYEAYDLHSDDDGERVIDVAYTGDRLGDGNVMGWYDDEDATDGLDGLLYSHEAIDDGSATSVWYNAGGRFDLSVPLQGTGISASSSDRTATVTLQVGDASTAAVAEGSATFVDYSVSGNRNATTWRSREITEDGDCAYDDDEDACEDED